LGETDLTRTLDFALLIRLREVLGDRPATETELRTLGEQGDAWARTLYGQTQSSERRLEALVADPGASLTEIADELRRLARLRPALTEVTELLGELETRTRTLRTAWLAHPPSGPKRRSRRPGARSRASDL
jgi:hypothetical protein